MAEKTAAGADVEKQAAEFRERIDALRKEMAKVIVGHQEVVEQILIAVMAGGHALLEGVPGIGKTLLVRTLSQCMNLRFSRIQFTPDLMPADIIGTNIIVEDQGGRKSFQFQRGPIFGNVILADEINRATPKTQSALLECMQEKAVTVQGVRYALDEPFFVLATQNPIEMEGTYPLPEAQVDRFMFKIEVRSPKMEDLMTIIHRTTGPEGVELKAVVRGDDILRLRALGREVPIATHVANFVARLVLATQPASDRANPHCRKYLRYGASPRAAQALVVGAKILALMKGRYNVSFADIREVAPCALRHRLILNFEAEAEGVRQDQLIAKLLEEVPEVEQRTA
jgi:MoxR-like ATPase